MVIIEKLQNAPKLWYNSDTSPGGDRRFAIASQFISQLISKHKAETWKVTNIWSFDTSNFSRWL